MDKKVTTVPRVVTALLLILAGSPALAEQRAIFLGNPEWLTNGIYDPIKKVFEEKGYKIEVMTLPCDADLGCWRQMSDNDPAWFKPFVAEAAQKLTNCECVLVGTSRAVFFALQIAANANIPRVVAIVPVVDLGALDEFRGGNQPASALTEASAISASVFIAIGSHDTRVGTQHSVEMARALKNATLYVPQSDQHTAPPGTTEILSNWLNSSP